MKPKKSKKANLENNKVIFFQVGLIVSLATALLAFEWSSGVNLRDRSINQGEKEKYEVDIINTYTKVDLPPEVKPSELFKLVIKDNSDDVLGKMFASTEIDPWDAVDFKDFPVATETPVDDIPFRICEDMPSFKNGDISEFVKYIQSIVIYPEAALNMDIQGKVYADFVVNKEGYIENVKIIRGVDPLLDNEVVRALKASPRWKPGRQRDIPVKVAYTIPITFKIN